MSVDGSMRANLWFLDLSLLIPRTTLLVCHVSRRKPRFCVYCFSDKLLKCAILILVFVGKSKFDSLAALGYISLAVIQPPLSNLINVVMTFIIRNEKNKSIRNV